MRILRFKVHNIGMVADETIELDKPLICLFGQIRVGKSTILRSVQLALGGSYPSDLVRHGEKEAFVELVCDDATIRREWYVSPHDGTVKDRKISCVLKGQTKPLDKPVEYLRQFTNPFMLDQDHFARMSEPARQRFFVDLLGVDTGELDAELTDLKDQRTSLEAKIAGYGDIDVTPVEMVDVDGLRKQLALTKKMHAEKVAGWQKDLEGLREQYQGGKRQELAEVEADLESIRANVRREEQRLEALRKEVAELAAILETGYATIKENEGLVAKLRAAVAALPDLKPQADALKAKIAAPLDTTALERSISDGAAANVRYEAYTERLAKAEQRKGDNELLDYAKARAKEIQKLKAAKLAEIAEQSGIPGLAFDESGSVLFEDTTAGMLSTSQIMRLSSLLSGLYPEGFGIELLDRGESLGKSIFGYIERAKRQEISILAAIVGEKPATVPDDVGVFVVEEGKVKP